MESKTRIGLILILALRFFYSSAQTYEGTIGKFPIFLQLELYEDGDATAFYFYKTHLQNIPLTGSKEGDKLVLTERFSYVEDKKELFTLRMTDENLHGKWQNGNAILNVKLSPTLTNLEGYKQQHMKLIRDSISTHNSKELVWFKEEHSKTILFRLGNGFSKSDREFLNPRLDSIQFDLSTIALDCDYLEMSVEVELISDNYISFSEFASTYCGGAHPNHNIAGYNFDLSNKIQLEKLTELYPNLDYYHLLKAKYENDTDLESECEYFDLGSDNWDYGTWVLTPKGISITPSYPHAMTPCETGFLLTYDEINQQQK